MNLYGSRVGNRDDSKALDAKRCRRIGRLDRGRLGVTGILSDLLLFSCLAAFIVGIVVAAASLLS